MPLLHLKELLLHRTRAATTTQPCIFLDPRAIAALHAPTLDLEIAVTLYMPVAQALESLLLWPCQSSGPGELVYTLDPGFVIGLRVCMEQINITTTAKVLQAVQALREIPLVTISPMGEKERGVFKSLCSDPNNSYYYCVYPRHPPLRTYAIL